MNRESGSNAGSQQGSRASSRLSNLPGPQLPLSVAKQLDNQIDLLSQTEREAEEQKRMKLDSVTTSFLNTAMLRNPQPVPTPTLKDETVLGQSLAMTFLMKDSDYTASALAEQEQQKMKETKQNVIKESLSSFFLGDAPQIKSNQFQQDPTGYAASVLEKLGKSGTQKLSELRAMQSQVGRAEQLSAALKQQKDTKHGGGREIRVQTRTLQKSVLMYQKLLAAPIAADASIFAVAQNSFNASLFLLADVTDAVQKDNKEAAEALKMVRNSFQRSFCDQKAGEFLLSAEINRLKQELFNCHYAREQQRKYAIETILSLEAKRVQNEKQLKDFSAQIEQKRVSEVNKLLSTTQQYQKQVMTLKGIVNAIKEDQAVLQIDELKKQIVLLQNENINLQSQLQDVQGSYNKLLGQFNQFKLDCDSMITENQTLKEKVTYLQSQRNICKNCQQFIETSLLTEKESLLNQINTSIQMLNDVEGFKVSLLEQKQKAQAELEEQPTVDFSTLHGNDLEQQIMDLKFVDLLKKQFNINEKLKKLPDIKMLRQQLNDQQQQLQKLDKLKNELKEVKQAYQQLLTVNENSGSGNAAGLATENGDGQQKSKQFSGQTVDNQNYAETTVTLVRFQPLYMVLSKLFDIQVVNPKLLDSTQLTEKNANLVVTSSQQVQVYIQQFLLQMAPYVLNNTDKNISMSALFNTFMKEQTKNHNNPAQSQTLHEINMNKVYVVLQKYKNNDKNIVDDSMFLSLGNFLLNSPATADEVRLTFYVYILARAGVISKDIIPFNKIGIQTEVTAEYMSVQRASSIIGYLLTNQTLSGFMQRLLQQGKSAGFVKEVAFADLSNHNIKDPLLPPPSAVIDSADINSGDLKVESPNVEIISISYFVSCVIKCYRAETLTRLEALRVLYAGQLLEHKTQLTEPGRYRVLRHLLETICPEEENELNFNIQHDQAYLDTVFRSPSGQWNIFLDSCRVIGLFNRALHLPQIDCLAQHVGGFKTQETALDTSGSIQKVQSIIRAFQMRLSTIKKLFGNRLNVNNIIKMLEEICNENINSQNLQLIILELRKLILRLNDEIFFIIQLGEQGDQLLLKEIQQIDDAIRLITSLT